MSADRDASSIEIAATGNPQDWNGIFSPLQRLARTEAGSEPTRPAARARGYGPQGRTDAASAKITIIGCPFRTTYGHYISALRQALETVTGSPVRWVASNCCCNDPNEISCRFQTQECDYFHMRNAIGRWTFNGYSRNSLKRALRAGVRYASNYIRVARYLSRAPGAEVIHLQQTLNAYGHAVASQLLRQCSSAARVITLHEFDPEQIATPERNRIYNLADAIIVHDRVMKEELVSSGVAADLIHVVCCGTDLAEGGNTIRDERDGIVFYGGHHLNKGKGLHVLFQAYGLLRDRRPERLPRLRIHGHYGPATPPDALEMAKACGVADAVDWLNELPMEDIAMLYRGSQVCVLPFTGSFAGLSAGVAAANRLPIVATRFAGIPDHIGDLGIWVKPDDPSELAGRIEQVLDDRKMAEDYGTRLRAHAERHLSWNAIAQSTLAVYQSAREHAQSG